MNVEELGNLVRHWVHYDSMLTTLNKQAKNVRDLRNTYEDQILEKLKTNNSENIIIQVAGGRILVGEEKHSTPLSFKNLELTLHQYFRQKPGQPDETQAIMKFIRTQRITEVSKCLKRQVAGASLPPVPPPALPPGGGTPGGGTGGSKV